MKRVLIGSLAAAKRSASRASSTGTPSSSNMMRPGATRQAQNSGAPLPLPMRTSVGFFETGTSGKIRIQTRPARRMCRVNARRAASIWRAVIRSGSSALRPNWPKFNSNPAFEAPRMRPLNAFRNFVRLGCNIIQTRKARTGRSGGIAIAPPPLAAAAGMILFGHFLVLRHRIVFKNFALEDPDLDPAGAIGRVRRRGAVIDIGAQCMQWHPAFAIPFEPCDFGAAEAARAVDSYAFRAEPDRRFHRPVHVAAGGDPAL